MKQKVCVCGDTHGVFDELNMLMHSEEPDIVIQTGDFGYYDRFDDRWSRAPTGNRIDAISKPANTKLYFVGGNHEHWLQLDNLVRHQKTPEPFEVRKNLFYCPTGSTLTLDDGTNILFMGGADSIDKAYRTPGVSWFSQEVLTEKHFYSLPDELQVDILVSHTCSSSELKDLMKGQHIYNIDPTWEVLEQTILKYKPSYHYFSHWHKYAKGKKWECLHMCPHEGWWKWLK